MGTTKRLSALAVATGLVTTALIAPATSPALAATSPTVLPTPAFPKSLPTPTTTTSPTSRNAASRTFTIGTRDLLQTDGALTWAPNTGVPFSSVYQYISGPGPGTPQDYKPYVVVAFAKAVQAVGAVPVLSYFRMNGNLWGSPTHPAACQGACTLGDSAKRNIDHLNDPSFMQNYFVGLVSMLQALDSQYDGQLVLHLEPDLSGYGQMLSNDRTRCGEDCISAVANDSPAAVRAAVASSRLSGLEAFPNTMQGFYLAVLRLRDLYAPRVTLAYHVSGWATANVFRKSGVDDPTNDIDQGTVAVDAAALGGRVAQFAALNGASRTVTGLPGPATSRYDLLFNDVLDHDAAYAELVGGNPRYWWDVENVDLPNFTRWETWVQSVTSRTGLKATIWQVPLGNTVYKVENDTYGHYQDNRAQYFFAHLPELAAKGITGVIFGGGNADSTSSSDLRLDVTDNSKVVCTTRGSHSKTYACPWRDAVVTDDDGGYLRQQASAYFRAPLVLSGS